MTDLVVCSLEAWDDVWRRNQFLVSGLLAGDRSLRVLFVEPSADPVHAMRSSRRAERGRGLRPGPASEGGRLQLLQLTKVLPRAAGAFADRGLARGLRRATHRLGMRAPVLWVNDPGWAPLAVSSGWPALYDVTDDWVLADRPEREHQRLLRNEAALLSTCREVVVCSPGLAESKGASRPVVLIPNAVDVARFRRPTARPSDLGPGRYVVYAGTLHEDRLDVALVLATARRIRASDRASRLLLVGPNALNVANTARLQAEPGVTLAGPRANDAIPGYLQHADALLVPHVVDAFTGSLDPIKLYEYRAVDRPVVSTPVAGFRDLAGQPGVHIVPASEFPEQVAALLRSGPLPPGPGPSGDHVATWADRVADVAMVLARMSARTA